MTNKKNNIIGVTCKSYHTTYYDMKKICKDENVYRTTEETLEGIVHVFYFQCEKCPEKTKVKINCEDFK